MDFRRFQKKHAIIVVVALVTFVALWQFTKAGADEPKTGRKAQVVPVVTAAAAVRSVPIEIRAIGPG